MSKIKDLNNLLLPQFNSHKLESWKIKDYLVWREIVLLIVSKAHLTPEGLNEIRGLKKVLSMKNYNGNDPFVREDVDGG